MKKTFRLIRDIITVRPLRKFLKTKLAEHKENKQFAWTDKWDGNVREKSILICEPHFCHGECFPGWTKYWQDLGYNVDIITRYSNYIEDPFCNYKNKPRMFAGSLGLLKKWLADKRMKQYEYIFISTSVIGKVHFLEFLGFVPECKHGCMYIDHAPSLFFDKYSERSLVEQKRIFALSNLPYIPQLNPHYFGEFKTNRKSHQNMKKFVAVGRIEARNYDALITAIRELVKQKEKFVIRVIGSGEMDIPQDLSKYIVHLGRLNYKDMYQEVLNSNFIIAGLDPFNQEQQLYLAGCTTGNLQLAFGFNKPMLINELFGKCYGLQGASIFYKDNDVLSAMKQAMNISEKQYKNLTDKLGAIAKKTYDRSLKNLKSAVKFTQTEKVLK